MLAVTTKSTCYLFLSLFLARQPSVGQGLLIHEVRRSHTTHHSRQDSSGRMISPSQRPLPDNVQNSQQINIHVPGGIRTHNFSRRAAADLRLRPRGYWDRQEHLLEIQKINLILFDVVSWNRAFVFAFSLHVCHILL